MSENNSTSSQQITNLIILSMKKTLSDQEKIVLVKI